MNVTVSWTCDKCGVKGTFQTSVSNVREYMAYYAVLMEEHVKAKKPKRCKFTPEKIHAKILVSDASHVQNGKGA